ncbi:hypothetical protein BKA59DRAFT_428116 [Fusarium tricinctum]|uniref:Uncharacterized protein n=1 Tax=Fusarium tricinctum TaxID=61284 RepID=A0A8K0W6P5_9HYPO|nr:hypothetical protein BKA59DRAFT_428116 [Fusarium tricinctum]
MDPDELKAHTEKLRRIARNAHDSRVPFDAITSDYHRTVLNKAIRNVLSTELAIFTYAQIIDGLPIADVAWDRRLPGIMGEHVIDEHETLCPGALEKAQEYYENWQPSSLMFDPETVKLYQNAEPGSKYLNTRLVELAAVSLHQIAVFLFRADHRLHQGDIDAVTNWKMPLTETMVDVAPGPTLFSHHAYLDDDIYPDGVADIVGYWAEDRILGGVVVFDQRPGSPDNVPNIYFHPCRQRQTIRVYQLRDEQQQALFDFLLQDEPSTPPSPLPILGDKQNRVRVDAPMAITHFHIYRDIWERKPLDIIDLRIFEKRPKDEIDYPEVGDLVRRINAQHGIPIPRPRSRSMSPPARDHEKENNYRDRG